MDNAAAAAVNQGQSQANINQGQPQVNVFFILPPGRTKTLVIDYSTTTGSMIWKNSTAKLYDELYGYTYGGLRTFLNLVKNRPTSYDWETILGITNNTANPLGPTTNFLYHYCEDSMHLDRLRRSSNTFTNNQTRAA